MLPIFFFSTGIPSSCPFLISCRSDKYIVQYGTHWKTLSHSVFCSKFLQYLVSNLFSHYIFRFFHNFSFQSPFYSCLFQYFSSNFFYLLCSNAAFKFAKNTKFFSQFCYFFIYQLVQCIYYIILYSFSSFSKTKNCSLKLPIQNF